MLDNYNDDDDYVVGLRGLRVSSKTVCIMVVLRDAHVHS